MTITPEQQLRNLSTLVHQLTEPSRRNVRKPDHYAGSKEDIADVARQLAWMVEQYLDGKLTAGHDDLPF